ncbi:hypothetical protein [Pseudohaliea rubra]|uniref:Uncharacterized protein n=1 Tax=Pseudohaliea rubra DSM 19751 TaxID=1265313 RepID=A0A095VNE7_9GAMM|nr:hypothetical protein [Pseudohaliea rubra]KGE02997.1 hypothetical protein HRUBRA_02435 [Pseudohaliea rubra DSM 19751]
MSKGMDQLSRRLHQFPSPAQGRRGFHTDIALGQRNAWIGSDFGAAPASGGNNDLQVPLDLNPGIYF